MAYDKSLANRIEELLKNKKAIKRKEMFGGVGYLLNGNMCVGVHKNDLLVRYDPKITEEVMKKKGTKPFAISGRPMKGWLIADADTLQGKALNDWIELSMSFVKTLPKK